MKLEGFFIATVLLMSAAIAVTGVILQGITLTPIKSPFGFAVQNEAGSLNYSFEVDNGTDYYPGFTWDNRTANDNFPDGWFEFYDLPNFLLDSSTKKHGSKSFKIYNLNNDAIQIPIDVPITNQKKYWVSIWIKTQLTAGWASLTTQCAYQDHGLLTQCDYAHPSPSESEKVRGNSDWTNVKYIVQGNEPSIYYLRPTLSTGYGTYGTVWFDLLQVVEVPSAPQNLTATPSSYNGTPLISLDWDDVEENGDGKYDIFESTDGTNFEYRGTVNDSNANLSVQGGQNYWFKVRAHNHSFYGDFSEVVGPVSSGSAEPLTVDAGGPYNVQVNQQFYLTATASGGIIPYTFVWQISNPNLLCVIPSECSNGTQNTSCGPVSCQEAGTATITLTVIDNANNNASDTASLTVTPEQTQTPSIPSNFRVTSENDSSLSLAWNESTGAQYYKIRFSVLNSGNWFEVSEQITGTTFTVNNLVNGTTYEFQIKACNDNASPSCSNWSSSIQGTPQASGPETPGTPTNLHATDVGIDFIELAWDSVQNTEYYKLKYAALGSADWTTITDITLTQYRVENLEASTIYNFLVAACNDNASPSCSDWSNTLQESTSAPPSPPLTPSNLMVTAMNKEVFIQWSYSIGATHYNVGWNTDNSTNYEIITVSNGNNYVHSNLENGTTYYYSVRACKTNAVPECSEWFSPNRAATPNEDYSVECGNNIVESSNNEECEPPNSSNNEFCVQDTSPICDYDLQRIGVRAEFGNCNANCVCEETEIVWDSNTEIGSEYCLECAESCGDTVCNCGETELSCPIDCEGQVDSTAPLPPTNLTAVPGNQLVELDWNDNVEEDLDHYIVYYGTYSGVYPNSLAVYSSSAVISNLLNGTEYFFVVTAVDSSGNESLYSSEVSAIPLPEEDTDTPLPPINFSAVFEGNKVKLEWQPVSPIPESFNVYRKESLDDTFSLISNTVDFFLFDENIEAGKTYYYVVRSVLNGLESSDSEIASVEIPVINVFPPTELFAVFDSNEVKIDLNWLAPTPRPDYYKVFRKIGDTGTFLLIGSTEKTFFTDSNIEINQKYYYMVRAVLNGIESNDSEVFFIESLPVGVATPLDLAFGISLVVVSGVIGFVFISGKE
jgi:fibronectin type 3 domain-containing protein